MTHSPHKHTRSTSGRRASKLAGSHGNPGWAFDNTCFVNRASLSTTSACVPLRAETAHPPTIAVAVREAVETRLLRRLCACP
jgi:hypothetical protein